MVCANIFVPLWHVHQMTNIPQTLAQCNQVDLGSLQWLSIYYCQIRCLCVLGGCHLYLVPLTSSWRLMKIAPGLFTLSPDQRFSREVVMLWCSMKKYWSQVLHDVDMIWQGLNFLKKKMSPKWTGNIFLTENIWSSRCAELHCQCRVQENDCIYRVFCFAVSGERHKSLWTSSILHPNKSALS